MFLLIYLIRFRPYYRFIPRTGADLMQLLRNCINIQESNQSNLILY